MKRITTVIILIFLLIYNIFFYYDLLFPFQNPKTIITPEFAGGDSVNVNLPYRKVLCQSIKEREIPFWIHNLSLGYPLYAEGEIGYFNPINYLSCLFFDYKMAFNIQIIFHSFLFQLALYFLALEIGMSIAGSLFLALLTPYVPFLLMNLMQFTLVFSFAYFPLVLLGLVKFFKQNNYSSFLFFSLAIALQFLASHIQISFISFITILVFSLSYLIILKKDFLKRVFLVIFGWFFGFLISAFQTFPLIEFAFNSERLSHLNQPFSLFDQNLNLLNLSTIVNPFINGRPQDGSYLFHQIADPWEGTIFIYYVSLFFLVLFVFNFLKGNLKKYNQVNQKKILALIFTSVIILLLALGKNSPLYLVHYLPFFSSFRFPSRFLISFLFFLTLFSAIGFDFFYHRYLNVIKTKSYKLLILFTLILILFFEQKSFFYDFHVLYPINNLFQNSLANDYFIKSKIKPIVVYTPHLEYVLIDKEYIKNGYSRNTFLYYHHLKDLIVPNVNLVYGIPSLINKTGPQLKRFTYFVKDFFEYIDYQKKIACLSPIAQKKMEIAGIDYLVSSFSFCPENDFLKKITDINYQDKKIKIYQNVMKKNFISFYQKTKRIKYLSQFEDELKKNKNLDFAFVEKNINLDNNQKEKNIHKIKILNSNDQYYQIEIETNKNGFLVLNTNYYPSWKAKIDGKSTESYRANFLFQGIFVPKGKHMIEFYYDPESFKIGLFISAVCFIVIFIIIPKVVLREY